ncbi:hypothetical protein AQS8620_01260 [Aquimixticola soesokkakensis]|uniref:Glycosyl transferase family 8 n=1 Tax=Aquimixticola soesokkakensis TaxID=1519096 RepID=A0A1Y5SB06_9RHOB|nr:hypothetical protein [Aquimixticola soesokkakensis]SLN35878.1 hypothetical protein AQS8620_01260 [Aquimixticola soesokkakensis]
MTSPANAPLPPADTHGDRPVFNVVAIAQNGRIMYEAALFAASLRHCDPDFAGRLILAVPQAGENWNNDPSVRDVDILDLYKRLGVEIIPFESKHFGQSYPYGNKIEALMALPKGEPFVFFDSDTLIMGPLSRVAFDFDRPCASLKCEGTWPEIELYGPGYYESWKSLYDRFGLDIEPTIDHSQPEEYWKRFLYFNAGFFFYRCPHEFGARFLEYALEIRDNPPPQVALQSFDPWLDQVALPLVIHSFGGARNTLPEDTLDGAISCHYRTFPLLYARENDHVIETLNTVAAPNWIKKVLKEYEPIKRLVYQNRGLKVRDMFDRNDLPRRERTIRNRIRAENLWMR